MDGLEFLAGDDALRDASRCPNCDAVGQSRPVLRAARGEGARHAGPITLRACACCGCGFFDLDRIVDYGAARDDGAASLAFYVQQGAGLWGMLANLAALGRPAGTRLLEVGCGFGFGLDMARRALGWEVAGIDPSPFAAAGRAALRLPIEARVMAAADDSMRGRFDVVMASEVIEHVAAPVSFVGMLAAALNDGGSLIVTTPDMDAIGPDLPPGLLLPALSIGFHAVLQSRRSLEMLLRRAGFAQVSVRRSGGASLIAQARRAGAPAPSVAPDPGALYARYLAEAAADAAADGDLWFGLVARAYRAAVNRRDMAAADRGWEAFAAACGRRFGADPEAMAPGPAMTLDRMRRTMPLCLGPVLLHRALHRLHRGEPRAMIEPLFARAATACAHLRSALRIGGTDDGDAEDTGWVARAEAALCAVERGDADGATRLLDLGPAPGDRAAPAPRGRGRIDTYRRRAFVMLVNAGRLEDATRLIDVVADVEARVNARGGGADDALADDELADDELDVLYCAATHELQRPGGSTARALELLRALRQACRAAVARGRVSGSAVTLTAPAEAAEALARERLGGRIARHHG